MTSPDVRVLFEASLDDMVDVAVRLAKRSPMMQRQARLFAWIGAVAIGAIAAATGRWLRLGWTPALLLGALAGAAATLRYRGFLWKEIARQQRKFLAEQLDGRGSLACETELRPEGLWTRQGGIETLLPWRQCLGVTVTDDAIEIRFEKGLSVMRTRYFADPVQKRAFAERATALAAAKPEATPAGA